jgi:hypothetical protein
VQKPWTHRGKPSGGSSAISIDAVARQTRSLMKTHDGFYVSETVKQGIPIRGLL